VNEVSNIDSVVVLYIGGEGRSGSTVLSALLGNQDGYFPVGEFRGVWNALKDDELCSCGEPFSSCEFWRSVGERGFGGWDRLDVEGMLKADGEFARHRSLLRLLLPSLRRAKRVRLNQYRELLAHLYTAVKEVSGCSVIVDSTKNSAYALILRDAPGVDVRFVHLVRDSRAVAYSWSKKDVVQPEYRRNPVLKDTLLGSKSSWRSALDWDVKNVLLHLVARPAPHRIVKYESFMSRPASEVERIFQLTSGGGSGSGEMTGRGGDREPLPHHMVGGNRVRFEGRNIRLRADYEWKVKMRLSQRVIVGAMTLPLLIAYGYVRVVVERRPSA
jgi:hypothetical protein